MNSQSALRKPIPDYLSVIHKSQFAAENDLHAREDLVLQTDLHFNITGLNGPASVLFERPGTTSRNLFEPGEIETVNGSIEDIKSLLFEKGYWTGQLCHRHFDGDKLHYKTTATVIKNEKQEPTAVLLVCTKIEDEKEKETELAEAKKQFEGLLNTLSNGVMMIDAKGNIISSNRRGAEILGLEESKIIGQPVAGRSWKGIRTDGSAFPAEQFPAIVSLQTGFPQRNVVIGVGLPTGNLVWLSINSDALIKPGEFNPYAAVLSFSDITTFISTQNELKESNERFRYISSITSDAIWDFDLTENTIYRSETFSRISGYPKSDINMNLNWWFDKIHPEDQARVKEKLEERLRLKNERWNDEYRFCYADGSYKMLKDSGIILYKDEKPVRIIGAISDITEEAKLKQQLIHEQTQKQKAVAKAALNAQEDEKARISRELHDNVNQIIMSAKLYMETARQAPENADKLLDKAIEYQLLALHEIRKLSKTLNTSAITGSDLKESIGDIVRNLEALQNIAVKLEIDSLTEKKLNEKAKLTVYRVIQEQTNNIIKYASATEVRISVKIIDGNAELVIADNGKGFEMSKKEGFTGIGLINMNSRAMAVDGSFDIKSSPGNGCVVIVRFPLSA